MKFVCVLNSIKPYKDDLDIMPSVFKHASYFLSTLAKAYGEKFSEDTYRKYIRDVKNYKSRYSVYNHELWIDSGGYNFVKGEYSKSNVDVLIDRYHRFLKEESDSFDKIFSLDLPLRSDKRTQYAINKQSIEKSLAAIKENSAVKDKMYFVGHFLRNDQYEIWNKLYKEYELYSVFGNRAIGGMVSSRKFFRDIPSPFIGNAYRYLFDFIKYGRKDNLTVHFLGIYLPQDRFTILLLEKIFSRYLKNVNINFSYDTISYSRKIKMSHSSYEVFFNKEGDIYLDPSLAHFDNILRLDKIYEANILEKARNLITSLKIKKDAKLKRDYDNFFYNELIEEKKASAEPGNFELLDPVGIYNNINIDRILSEAIDKYSFVDKIMALDNLNNQYELIQDFIYSASHCCEKDSVIEDSVASISENSVFGSFHFLKIISLCIREVVKFHLWFIKNQDDENMLDNMNIEFIKHFNK